MVGCSLQKLRRGQQEILAAAITDACTRPSPSPGDTREAGTAGRHEPLCTFQIHPLTGLFRL